MAQSRRKRPLRVVDTPINTAELLHYGAQAYTRLLQALLDHPDPVSLYVSKDDRINPYLEIVLGDAMRLLGQQVKLTLAADTQAATAPPDQTPPQVHFIQLPHVSLSDV
jgi:hypothetical protein